MNQPCISAANVNKHQHLAEDSIPRILEVDPIAAVGLDALRAAMEAAAIRLALNSVRHFNPNSFKFSAVEESESFCQRCGALVDPGVVLKHKPDCDAGIVLAYFEAVNEARMGAERRRENRSLLAPQELHIQTRRGEVLNHAEAAAAHAAGSPFIKTPNQIRDLEDLQR